MRIEAIYTAASVYITSILTVTVIIASLVTVYK